MGESGKRAAAAAALVLVSGTTAANAQQTVIDLPVSQLLSNGGSYAGTFDISSLLHNSAGDFQVTSATLELGGYSAFGETSTAPYYYTYPYTAFATGYYTYKCGWDGWSYCEASYEYPYTAYATVISGYVPIDLTPDSLTLSSGGEQTTVSDSSTGWPPSYYGSLLAQLTLGGTQIADANSNGSISFTASAVTNTNVQLNDASLRLDLSAISAVPEPTTWAMMIIGFGAIGLSLRRSRKRTARVAIG